MADTPQIKCLGCKASMSYTAAECPNCKRRMIATAGNPNSGSGVQTVNRATMFGGVIASGVFFVLILICCSSGKESPKQQKAIERQEEMRPVATEMNRKMSEGKTKEQAAREIVDEAAKRQEQIQQLDNLIEEENRKKK